MELQANRLINLIRPLVLGAAAWVSGTAFSQMTMSDIGLGQGFSQMAFVSPANFLGSLLDQARHAEALRDFCGQLKSQYHRYKWQEEPCGRVKWRADLRSQLGRPLIYAEFGDPKKETTLLLGGVHPDELTPINLAFRFARYLDEHPEVAADQAHVIIAPLVSPDGFIREHPTRTNANGIDVNRNFFTADWYDKAQKIWQQGRGRSPAHFPGYFPNTEIETLFQIALIDRYRPDKILSIHAPLGFLDYDGPGSGVIRPLTMTEKKAKRLVKAIAESSQNYKVVDYMFYPGSLGNYAGNERHIPTVTLELQTTDPRKSEAYWKQFEPGIMQTIRYPFSRTPVAEQLNDIDNASPFSLQYLREGGTTI